jgi:hypothetical protein
MLIFDILFGLRLKDKKSYLNIGISFLKNKSSCLSYNFIYIFFSIILKILCKGICALEHHVMAVLDFAQIDKSLMNRAK